MTVANPAQPSPAEKALTEMEVAAIGFLMNHGGSVLVTSIPDKSEKGLFGEKVPGMPVYKKLEKRGLIVLTVEDIEEDGFQFTSTAETTAMGEASWREATGQAARAARTA